MQERKYRINDRFIAVFNPMHDTIQFGNPQALITPCIEIKVEPLRKTICLQTVLHNVKCDMLNELKNGKTGIVAMMHLALVFAKALFPKCIHVELLDMIGYHDKLAGFNVILSDRDMFFTGQTWYQRHLHQINLVPVTANETKLIKRCLHVLQLKPSKKDKIELKTLGFATSTSLTIIENLNKQKEKVGGLAYLQILTVQRFYNIPSLSGIAWIGDMINANPFNIDIFYEQIEMPQNMLAMWGGWKSLKSEPLRNNVISF